MSWAGWDWVSLSLTGGSVEGLQVTGCWTGLGSQGFCFTNAVVEDIQVASRVMAYLPTWPGRHSTANGFVFSGQNLSTSI